MASKTWFITGTSSGFGLAMVDKLLARGDRVAATLRRPGVLDGLKARHGERLWVAKLDVTDTGAVRRVVNRAWKELGRIDVVVSNAGYGLFGAAEEVSDAQVLDQLATNVTGSIQVLRAVLPHLREQGGGRILQLSSMGGQIGMPGLSLYHASKWAVEGFCESLHGEVAPFGIQVTLVEPGGAATEFSKSGAVMAVPMPVYEASVVGAMRRRVGDPNFRPPGDPAKMVQAMIDCADQPVAPHRLLLGSDAYNKVRAALLERLDALGQQQALAFSTDAVAPAVTTLA